MKYDSFIIGPVSLDVNIDCEGNVEKNVGGAVVYSGLAASQCGWNTAVLTKANAATCEVEPVFAGRVYLYGKMRSLYSERLGRTGRDRSFGVSFRGAGVG